MFIGILRGNIRQASSCINIPTDPETSITVNEYDTFTVYANVTAGSSPLTYQWQEKPPFGGFSNISGATSSSYTKTGGLLVGDSVTEYKCNISNACSSASRTTTVTVVGEIGGGGGGPPPP